MRLNNEINTKEVNMVNKLEIFKNEEFGEVRTVEIKKEPWFCLSDICKALGIINTTDVAKRVDNDELTRLNLGSHSGETNFVNESGLYSVILRSDKPEAKKFRKWITSEVLPTIRKHGMYATEELLDNPDLLIKVATALKEEREARKQLEKENKALTTENEIMKPKADYFDDLVERNLLTNIRNTAKELKIREKDFVKFLINHGFIYRELQGTLRPYAAKNNGLFELKEYSNTQTGHAGVQTMITPKGRETFRILIK